MKSPSRDPTTPSDIPITVQHPETSTSSANKQHATRELLSQTSPEPFSEQSAPRQGQTLSTRNLPPVSRDKDKVRAAIQSLSSINSKQAQVRRSVWPSLFPFLLYPFLLQSRNIACQAFSQLQRYYPISSRGGSFGRSGPSPSPPGQISPAGEYNTDQLLHLHERRSCAAQCASTS